MGGADHGQRARTAAARLRRRPAAVADGEIPLLSSFLYLLGEAERVPRRRARVRAVGRRRPARASSRVSVGGCHGSSRTKRVAGARRSSDRRRAAQCGSAVASPRWRGRVRGVPSGVRARSQVAGP